MLAYLADELERIQVVILAVQAQLDLAIGALTQGLHHHILVHKGAPLRSRKDALCRQASTRALCRQATALANALGPL